MKILISAAGTGGHVFPAQKMARQLKSAGHDIFFAGHHLNEGFFQKEFRFYDVKSASLSKNKLFVLPLLLRGFFQSLRILWKEKPSLAIGFGSFHTFPVMLAAKVLCIPIMIVEANVSMGRVNRFFAKSAIKIIEPLKEREEVFSVERRLQTQLTLLIFGGSQGAVFLNKWILNALSSLKETLDFKVIHLTGKNTPIKMVEAFYKAHHIEAKVKEFETDMASLYAEASLVISRAGGSTLKELIDYELPAFLIPYPYASEQHQKKNAQWFCEQVKGGDFCEQKNLQLDEFVYSIQKMIKNLPHHKKKIRLYKGKQTLMNMIELVKQI